MKYPLGLYQTWQLENARTKWRFVAGKIIEPNEDFPKPNGDYMFENILNR